MLTTLLIGFIWYQIIAHVGISAGLHRCLAHKAFKANSLFEILILYMCVLAGSRSPIGWISSHRMHHHHSDTDLDPHSPSVKGFLKIFFSRWTIPSIPAKYVKDLYNNPRIVFFHYHWRKIWIITAIITLLISPYFFVAFVLMPAILSLIGFGMVNAITHMNKSVRNVPWINLLTAGEGYHKEHHDGRNFRYHKFDQTGFVLEYLEKMRFIERLKD